MADTGWLSAGSQSNGANWVTPANILVDDGVNATIANPPDVGASYIRVYNFTGLVAALATASVIDGIEFQIKGRSTAALSYSYFFAGQAVAGSPQSVTSFTCPLPVSATTPAYVSVGGAAILWGGVDTDANGTFNRNWLVADFDAGFGISGNFVGGTSVLADAVQLKVYFTAASSPFKGLMMMGCGT